MVVNIRLAIDLGKTSWKFVNYDIITNVINLNARGYPYPRLFWKLFVYSIKTV